MKKDIGIVGTVARFKPVHNGHAIMLETICARADEVKIGLGSSNRYNTRNPFTAQESAEMIDVVLKSKFSNYSFIEVPDLDDGPKWREKIIALYGKLDYFITANDYVLGLLKQDYQLILPVTLIAPEHHVRLSATMVRENMTRGGHWEEMVPDQVVSYIKDNHLDERFRKEFGLATLAGSFVAYLKTMGGAL